MLLLQHLFQPTAQQDSTKMVQCSMVYLSLEQSVEIVQQVINVRPQELLLLHLVELVITLQRQLLFA